MEIASIEFLLLLLCAIIVYYVIPARFRLGFLVILSFAFIAGFSIILPVYIITYTYLNFILGKRIPLSKAGKSLFRIGIVLNLTQLVLLRYASFAIDPVFSLFGSDFKASFLSDIILPIGISYYTLQGIGYLINIKMGWEKTETSFLNLLLYITFFPKFLSGPIERSNHFLPQIKDLKGFNEQNIMSGFRTILFGLFKKITIANQLAPYIIETYQDIYGIPGETLWLIIILQPLYLYFDFSGYTDIAIGSARLFGIDLLPNFNRPFFTRNMTGFWRRFHISLSSWFNDYVFRQLSFRLRSWGIYATIIGVFITWMLFGIWHGAGWTFMFLGFLQAVVIIYEFFTKRSRALIFSKIPEKAGLWIGRVSTYLFFCIALIFFFAPDMKTVSSCFKILSELKFDISFEGISTTPFMLIIYIPLLWFIELLEEDYNPLYMKLYAIWQSDKQWRMLRWTVYSIIITTLIIAGFKDQQFVYANF